eukprot:TRINITY_DN714_c0_g5_i1.p1 TRINITY_DN714_c0_g5~~TRINITY_DN714_c0_g5_i1.p1  ORF type:complete len:389 (-),score=106.02 TRINITY_DN714_c0_g5_i1:63-1229(-)
MLNNFNRIIYLKQQKLLTNSCFISTKNLLQFKQFYSISKNSFHSQQLTLINNRKEKPQFQQFNGSLLYLQKRTFLNFNYVTNLKNSLKKESLIKYFNEISEKDEPNLFYSFFSAIKTTFENFKLVFKNFKEARKLQGSVISEKKSLTSKQKLFISQSKQDFYLTFPFLFFFMIPILGNFILLLPIFIPQIFPRAFWTEEVYIEAKNSDLSERAKNIPIKLFIKIEIFNYLDNIAESNQTQRNMLLLVKETQKEFSEISEQTKREFAGILLSAPTLAILFGLYKLNFEKLMEKIEFIMEEDNGWINEKTQFEKLPLKELIDACWQRGIPIYGNDNKTRIQACTEELNKWLNIYSLDTKPTPICILYALTWKLKQNNEINGSNNSTDDPE